MMMLVIFFFEKGASNMKMPFYVLESFPINCVVRKILLLEMPFYVLDFMFYAILCVRVVSDQLCGAKDPPACSA